jgi:hypothetical protein
MLLEVYVLSLMVVIACLPVCIHYTSHNMSFCISVLCNYNLCSRNYMFTTAAATATKSCLMNKK